MKFVENFCLSESNTTIHSFWFLQYLKDQRLPPQTFIPLQSVRVKPVIERLRTLGGTAKLVFDVIQYPLKKFGISQNHDYDAFHAFDINFWLSFCYWTINYYFYMRYICFLFTVSSYGFYVFICLMPTCMFNDNCFLENEQYGIWCCVISHSWIAC